MTSETEEDSVNQSSHNAGNAMNINDEEDEEEGDDEENFFNRMNILIKTKKHIMKIFHLTFNSQIYL